MAASLTFTLYHCLNNREVWRRLSEDIRTKFTSADEITGQSTATLPFLDAVIREGECSNLSVRVAN